MIEKYSLTADFIFPLPLDLSNGKNKYTNTGFSPIKKTVVT